jgi:N-dimethylarginine dimethylaminohydrolase
MINSHNEWDPVEELIVGTAKYCYAPSLDKGLTTSSSTDGITIPFEGVYPEKIIDETEEDLNVFIDELTKLGIKVKRPSPPPISNFSTPDWECDRFFPYCPRDTLLAVGNKIIETPGIYRSRYFETICYKDLLKEYMSEGSIWLSAPKPRLLDNIYDQGRNIHSLRLNNDEPVFDAANVLRAGRDIFYQISDSGNEMGMKWLQSVLGQEYRVHPISPNIYSSVHIDSTLVFLKPGLLLANPERVNPDLLPDALKQWKIIYAPDMAEYSYSDLAPMSSKWLGMNLLMLSPDLAVVDSHQVELIKLLESHAINVLPLKLRHGQSLGGGFHCTTLDTKRRGSLETYFD